MQKSVKINAGPVELEGNLVIPNDASGIVAFAHGSGSSRHSPRNTYVADSLNHRGLATLLFDLLTTEEETMDLETAQYRFDIALLAERLVAALKWLREYEDTKHLNVGYFGSSTGGGAALVAAAEQPEGVVAVVSRGGRPDLAGEALPKVKAPTLLIVGGNDGPVIEMNKDAMAQMTAETKLEIVPGASHLFEEPGTLDQVTVLAGKWFQRYL